MVDWGLLNDVGLLIIAAAWVIQAIQALRGKRALHIWFIGLYSAGTAALVVADIQGSGDLITLNLVILVLALIVLAGSRRG